MAQPDHDYHYFVGNKRYESADSSLTGAQIKERAAAQAGDGLLLEGRGNDPDEVIADDRSIELDHKHGGPRRFRIEPAATFGG